jgi:hypothetical protein
MQFSGGESNDANPIRLDQHRVFPLGIQQSLLVSEFRAVVFRLLLRRFL